MSSIPAAIDALVANVRIAAGDGVQVADGQPDEWTEDDAIIIGWALDRLSVTTEITRESLGTENRERYEITCLAVSSSGDTEMKLRRDRVFELYDLVANSLRRDQTLRGTVLRARPSVVDLEQVQVTEGASVALTFTVDCNAFA